MCVYVRPRPGEELFYIRCCIWTLNRRKVEGNWNKITPCARQPTDELVQQLFFHWWKAHTYTKRSERIPNAHITKCNCIVVYFCCNFFPFVRKPFFYGELWKVLVFYSDTINFHNRPMYTINNKQIKSIRFVWLPSGYVQLVGLFNLLYLVS